MLSKARTRKLRRLLDSGISVDTMSRYSLESWCIHFGIHRYGSNTLWRSSTRQLQNRLQAYIDMYRSEVGAL